MSLNFQRVIFVLGIVFLGAGCVGAKRTDFAAVNPKEKPRPYNLKLAAGANKYFTDNSVVIFVTVENSNLFPLHPGSKDFAKNLYFYVARDGGDSRPRPIAPLVVKALSFKKEVAAGSAFLLARYEFNSEQFGSTGVFFLSAKTLDEKFFSAPLRLEIANRHK